MRPWWADLPVARLSTSRIVGSLMFETAAACLLAEVVVWATGLVWLGLVAGCALVPLLDWRAG